MWRNRVWMEKNPVDGQHERMVWWTRFGQDYCCWPPTALTAMALYHHHVHVIYIAWNPLHDYTFTKIQSLEKTNHKIAGIIQRQQIFHPSFHSQCCPREYEIVRKSTIFLWKSNRQNFLTPNNKSTWIPKGLPSYLQSHGPTILSLIPSHPMDPPYLHLYLVISWTNHTFTYT